MRLELVSATGELREVTVARAEYPRSALGAERVIDVAGRKVGYLELQSFRKAADENFIDAAERLRKEGIQELVLDLRMNPGGRVYASLRIASAIGGKRLDGRIFKRLVHNDRYRDRDRDLLFDAPLRGALSLSRVFIITSRDSCSASEGLINGLAPHMEVVTIGGTTCGKPVGSSVLEYGEREYSIITFRSINARGEGDYYNGLRPTCGAENDVRRDFGDPEEASFKAALHYIEHGRCPEPSVWL
jgi:C-terminal processing protease CtpA/Prc